MNQIQDGLFAAEDTMPCNPRDIRIGHYTLPSTLQRAEREEAAARILTFSQQLDSWVGVSWYRLGKMMHEEFEGYQMWNEAKRQNHEEELRYRKALQKDVLLTCLTLGIYALFVKKPTKQLREVPDFNMPTSGIFIAGPRHVVEGIRELVDGGMLKHVKEIEGDNTRDIFFPTPTLISTIMRKQGLTTA